MNELSCSEVLISFVFLVGFFGIAILGFIIVGAIWRGISIGRETEPPRYGDER